MWSKEIPTTSGLYYRFPSASHSNCSNSQAYSSVARSATPGCVELVHFSFNEINHRVTCTILYTQGNESCPTTKYAIYEKYNLEGKYMWKVFNWPVSPNTEYFPRDFIDDEDVKEEVHNLINSEEY